MSREQVVEILEDEFPVQCYDHETIDALRTALLVNLKDEGKLQEFCEDNRIDAYQREAYEHWIVSQWLADRLAEKGENGYHGLPRADHLGAVLHRAGHYHG
jgi:hypothetical protein